MIVATKMMIVHAYVELSESNHQERGFHQQKWCMLMGFDGIIGIWGILHMDVLGYNGTAATSRLTVRSALASNVLNVVRIHPE